MLIHDGKLIPTITFAISLNDFAKEYDNVFLVIQLLFSATYPWLSILLKYYFICYSKTLPDPHEINPIQANLLVEVILMIGMRDNLCLQCLLMAALVNFPLFYFPDLIIGYMS
jgi:hypothetical protein